MTQSGTSLQQRSQGSPMKSASDGPNTGPCEPREEWSSSRKPSEPGRSRAVALLVRRPFPGSWRHFLRRRFRRWHFSCRGRGCSHVGAFAGRKRCSPTSYEHHRTGNPSRGRLHVPSGLAARGQFSEGLGPDRCWRQLRINQCRAPAGL